MQSLATLRDHVLIKRKNVTNRVDPEELDGINSLSVRKKR